MLDMYAKSIVDVTGTGNAVNVLGAGTAIYSDHNSINDSFGNYATNVVGVDDTLTGSNINYIDQDESGGSSSDDDDGGDDDDDEDFGDFGFSGTDRPSKAI